MTKISLLQYGLLIIFIEFLYRDVSDNIFMSNNKHIILFIFKNTL